MRKIFSLLVAVFMAAMTFGQSYGILVNGTTYYAGEHKGYNFEGFDEYLSHVPVQAGDYCQLYDAENEVAWAVTLNTYSEAGFTLNDDRYEVSVSGCYDFYIQLKYSADQLYIGSGSDCGDGVVIGGEEEMDTVYTWYGKRGESSATEAIETGGTAAAYGGNSNIVVGSSQKTNWTIKLNKGFSNANFVGITLDKALEAGDKLQVAAFRTSASDAVFGIDFSEDAEHAATTCQILFPNNLQQISSNVAPEDTTFTVPDCAVGAKFIRIYRNSGSTGIYVANFTVLREKGGDTPEPPVAAKFYVTGDSALVADAAGDASLAWNPAAIKAEADTLVLNLKAEQVYKLKVTTDGTWNTVKGFNDLTEKPEGVTMDNDENIIFSLAEVGAVQVIYIAGETPIFKIAGNFYVEPTPDPAKFYITGDSALLADAAGDASLAWNPAAIKAEADTLVLNLKAEQYYKLKVTTDGTWNTVKGFNDLTEKPEGVTMDNDENIIFSLAEAGTVQVIYIAGETPIFKIAGNFYVEPTPDPAKFYITGDSALLADAAGDASLAWNPAAIKAEVDTLVLNLKAEQYYKLKVTADGTWNTAKGFNDLTEKPAGVTMDNDENIIFSLAEAGTVQVIYIAGETPIFKIAGNFYVEPTPPTVENGFYLVGSMNDWTASAEYKFAVNPDNENEYVLQVTLDVNDELKVKKVEEGQADVWFPAEGDNYIVDDHHNGATAIYFRPDYQGGEDWFAGCIYVVPTSTVGFENTAADTKAVKVLKNGILVIEKNNKVYNVLGIEMK